ncbi:hypothetical protein PHYBLDRAFT_178860 [Phycomyces blakesleeanus NRRL 1555(-)]|uniref:Uncharacterized protein n=1 Tax=Phycomyces blakesleeanus (strain ATCC 8743b / DSM 1359 / FGSC 10004 / NBRC 33097 / NRRL 1555) TaxID=763407 RepID=A0A162YJC0_PHYB8|nr:hypothetical protein PHYBLDRAFT_178860 [Phycomyces blakesleeanus NRRL 1555(-)]OAD81085.1 hypothetical protein PHYBLDRAFT_178860 [Phycomyces blakesleeanus NRRL 1555(-)]|eukprot:XP_018299125.1 hypothetical protein PHYBLDRAFT_178860 [Phycomyces blakesleeanus NRRL 1555(-)]
MDALTIIQNKYKDADKLRTVAHTSTEIYEELQFLIDRGGADDNKDVLQTILEKTRRLAVYWFASGKAMDGEAKELTTKALKLPTSVKFLEDEIEKDKDMVFTPKVVASIQQARYEESML